MIDSDSVVEAMIKDKGLTGPRVTPKQIDGLVASLTFHTHTYPGTTATVALAVLPNGFVVGQGQSACVDPANFDKEIGDKIAVDNARDNARQKLWELEGYVLKKHPPAPALNFQERVIDELDQLTEKINKLAPFFNTITFNTLDTVDRDLLREQYRSMMTYANTLVARIERFEIK